MNSAYCEYGVSGCAACRVSSSEEARHERTARGQMNMTTTTCPRCTLQTPASGKYCMACGVALPSVYDEAKDAASAKVPVSSGKRLDTSPGGRRAFLDDPPSAALRVIRRVQGGDWMGDVSRADDLCSVCDEDAERFRVEMQGLRVNFRPELAAGRELDPGQRQAYVLFLDAEARWDRAVKRAEAARTARARLLSMGPEPLAAAPDLPSGSSIYGHRSPAVGLVDPDGPDDPASRSLYRQPPGSRGNPYGSW